MNAKREHEYLQNRDAMIMIMAKGFVNAGKKNELREAGSKMAKKNEKRVMLFSNKK
jgi:hypothetical protein